MLSPGAAGATETPFEFRLRNDHGYRLAVQPHARCRAFVCGVPAFTTGAEGHDWGGSVVVVVATDPIDELASLFLFLAETDFAGYSPLYENLARSVAADREMLGFIAGAASPNTRRGRIPVLFFAAVHDATLAVPDSDLAVIYRGDSDGDPHEALVRFVDEQQDLLTETMRTRSVQTNEVGRSAVLLPALVVAAAGRTSVALVEVGPSAGVNLYLDRYHITYERDGASLAEVGSPESPVHLRCSLRGDALPGLGPVPDVVTRSGIDLAPLDATDPRQRRWLNACIWPGQPQRTAALNAALDVVADGGPDLVRGDAVAGLAPRVSLVANDQFPVVVSTWALAYLSASEREDLLSQLDAIGAQRDLALITFEEPRFTPWIPAPDPADDQREGDGTLTALGLRTWRGGRVTSSLLGYAHPHGRWLRWLRPAVP